MNANSSSLRRWRELLQHDILKADEDIAGQLNAQRMVHIQQMIANGLAAGKSPEFAIYLGHLAEHTRFPFDRFDAWRMALDMLHSAKVGAL